MTSILVTGATGFLGKKLCYKLKELGFSVTAVGRNKLVGAELIKNNINFVECDICNTNSLKNAMKNQDFVVHCAALSSLWGKYENFYQANVLGTRSVVESCLSNKVKRLIHISTPSIYFNFSDRFNIKESDILPKKMVNHYATTKFLAEQIVDQAFTCNLETIILRPRGIFGPEDNALLPRLIKVNQNTGIPLINNGQQLTDLTYVDNVVHAIILSLNSPKESLGKKYNITNDEPIALIDLFTKIFSQINTKANFKRVNFNLARYYAFILELIYKIFLSNKEPTLTQYSVLAIGKSMTLNIDEAKKYLNYKPQISLEEGITKYTDWWNKKND